MAQIVRITRLEKILVQLDEIADVSAASATGQNRKQPVDQQETFAFGVKYATTKIRKELEMDE